MNGSVLFALDNPAVSGFVIHRDGGRFTPAGKAVGPDDPAAFLFQRDQGSHRLAGKAQLLSALV